MLDSYRSQLRLDKNAIDHPREKTFKWLNELKESLSTKKGDEKQVTNKCDITGLDKVKVLKALFNATSPGAVWPSSNNLSDEKIMQALIDNDYNIDYLGGKPLKVNLSGNCFDTFLYNRENGVGHKKLLQI